MEYILFAGIVYIVFIMYIEITNTTEYAFPVHYDVLFVRLLPHIFGICSLVLNIVLLSILYD